METITAILTDLATCLCAQIITDGLPAVCFCGVVPGEQVSLDYVGDCEDACGMAWVRMVTIYPSTVVGQPSTFPGNCGLGLGLDVELGIMRCISVGGEDGQPPSPPELTAAAVLQQADVMAMWRAIACCRTSKDWVINTYTPLGPEGGIVGGTLSMSILVL